MKQLLFILILFLFGLHLIQAQNTNPIEETTWNVIRERLFGGANSKVFRFQEDIRFQLKGEVTKEDSLVMQNIVYELKELIEVVDVKLVTENGNFIFTIYPPENEITSRIRFNVSKNSVSSVTIELNSNLITSASEKRKFFAYHSFFYLTKTFEPKYGRTGYFGIFDSPTFDPSGTIKEIDKDLIRILYSNDFYKELKRNTVKNLGYLYYFNLRFEDWVKRISTSLSVILIIIGFLYLLSVQKSNRVVTFWNYQKRSMLVVVWIAVFFTIFLLPGFIPFITYSRLWVFLLGNFAATLFYGILAPVILYYLEFWYLKKFDKFFQKQIFIFVATFVSIFISYVVVSMPFV